MSDHRHGNGWPDLTPPTYEVPEEEHRRELRGAMQDNHLAAMHAIGSVAGSVQALRGEITVMREKLDAIAAFLGVPHE